MANNYLLVLDKVLSNAKSIGRSIDLVAIREAFVYDINQRPENCDLVVARRPEVFRPTQEFYLIPFINASRGEAFPEMTRRNIREGITRFLTTSVEDGDKTVLYRIDGSKTDPEEEYSIVKMSGLRARVDVGKLQRVESVIKWLSK